MLQIKTFVQAEAYLNLHIRRGSVQIFQGEFGLERERYFLGLLGSPQNQLKVTHIAGTAGKGSTCYLISTLLSAHGFKTGLHLSPHLTDVRERFQINNKIISKKEFIFYLNKIIPFIEEVKKSKYGDLSYFELLAGLAFHIFKEKKVDYAIVETGLGGWYDATNIVDRIDKVAVLTKIGFDHMEILGSTLGKIAFQKAMIINENSQSISIDQSDEAKKVITKVAKEKHAEMNFVDKQEIKLALIGEYQKENASLALKTVELLAKRDHFKLSKKKVGDVFKKAHFIGRFDVKKINGKTVVLDGAHNQPKMKAFTGALKIQYPKKKFHFLIAFKKGKDYSQMLKYIVPLASKITITSFFSDNQDLIHLSERPNTIVSNLNKMDFKNYQIFNQPKDAFESVLKKSQTIIVITGSLYLLGEIYKIM